MVIPENLLVFKCLNFDYQLNFRTFFLSIIAPSGGGGGMDYQFDEIDDRLFVSLFGGAAGRACQSTPLSLSTVSAYRWFKFVNRNILHPWSGWWDHLGTG